MRRKHESYLLHIAIDSVDKLLTKIILILSNNNAAINM